METLTLYQRERVHKLHPENAKFTFPIFIVIITNFTWGCTKSPEFTFRTMKSGGRASKRAHL
jgi:hypothetical protein